MHFPSMASFRSGTHSLRGLATLTQASGLAFGQNDLYVPSTGIPFTGGFDS